VSFSRFRFFTMNATLDEEKESSLLNDSGSIPASDQINPHGDDAVVSVLDGSSSQP
jgi:hypothetical protein